MEIWKDIPGYEGFYQASTLGRIRSITHSIKHPKNETHYGKIRKPRYDKNNYAILNLCKDGKVKTHKVHRLVAQTFIPNPHGYETVDHINCIKYDNRIENLRWCTTQENTKHRDETYEIGERARKKVLCKETNEVFTSSYNAAFFIIKSGRTKCTNYKSVSKSIRFCCIGKYSTSYGFHWAYI